MPKLRLQTQADYFYEERGAGEPVLFLHGSGVCWKMWEPQIEEISKKYRMILVDLRGHGQSTKEFPNDVYSMHVIAEDLIDFLHTLQIEQLPLVGVSQGGVVAQLVAIKRPSLVSKLIVSDSWSEMPTKAAPWVVKLSNWVFSKMSDQAIMNAMMRIYGKDEYTKRIIRENYTFDREMLFRFKTSEFPTHTEDLPLITADTLILAGDKKPFLGIDEVKGGLTLLNHIPRAKLAIFQDAFDPITTMRRDTFNDMLLDFLDGQPLKPYAGVRYLDKSHSERD